MFESLIQQIVSSLLGDYLESLNDANISLSLLQGQLILEDIPLRAQKFSIINLELQNGLIGRFSFTIPVGSFFKSSTDRCWIMEVADVFIIMTPTSEYCDITPSNEAPEMALIEQIASWSQTVMSVCNKIQIVIKNVHIVFRDHFNTHLRINRILIELSSDVQTQQIELFDLTTYIDQIDLKSHVDLKLLLSPIIGTTYLMEIEKYTVDITTDFDSLEVKIEIEIPLVYLNIATHMLDIYGFPTIRYSNIVQTIRSLNISLKVDKLRFQVLNKTLCLKTYLIIDNLQFGSVICCKDYEFNLNLSQISLQISEDLTTIDEDLFFDANENVTNHPNILEFKHSVNDGQVLSLIYKSNYSSPLLKVNFDLLEISIDEKLFNLSSQPLPIKLFQFLIDFISIDIDFKDACINLKGNRLTYQNGQIIEYLKTFSVKCHCEKANSIVWISLTDIMQIRVELIKSDDSYQLNLDIYENVSINLDYIDLFNIVMPILLLVERFEDLMALKDLFNIGYVKIRQQKSYQVIFFDHISHLPLFKIETSGLTIDCLKDEILLSQINIIDYFNYRKDVWEPFMSEAKLNVELNLSRSELIFYTDSYEFTLTQDLIFQLINYYKLIPSVKSIIDIKPRLTQTFNITIQTSLYFVVYDILSNELICLNLDELQWICCLKNTSIQSCLHIKEIQIDNQLMGCNEWQFFYCGQKNELESPALKLEMACKLYEPLHLECFRLKFTPIALNVDEFLLRKLVKFWLDLSEFININYDLDIKIPIYFGNLELDIGQLIISVRTLPNGTIPPELNDLLQFPLVSFENAQIEFSVYRQLFRKFDNFGALASSIFDFYLYQILRQALSIACSIDLLGSPSTLTSELEKSLHSLLFDGNLGEFIKRFSFGLTNSVSKLAASLSHGVEQLTSDIDHEVLRQKFHSEDVETTAFSHFFIGVKSFGIGFYGGLTALAKNTLTGGHTNGMAGILNGLTTGIVDTIAKPTKGLFDLIEGTALAVRSTVGENKLKLVGFPHTRIRLPQLIYRQNDRICRYDKEFVEYQHAFHRIVGLDSREILKSHLVCFSALIDSSFIQHHVYLSDQYVYLVQSVDNKSHEILHRIRLDQIYLCNPISIKNIKQYGMQVNFKDDELEEVIFICSSIELAKKLVQMIT